MVQTAKFYLKAESLPSKGTLDRKLKAGLILVLSLAAVYYYLQYLHHITHPRLVATKHVAPSGSPITSGGTGLAAAAPGGANPLVSTNNANTADALPPKHSLGDSLMAIFMPSASAETVQPEMQPAKTEEQPAALPAARQTLPVPPPVHHAPPPLTDDQKLALAAKAACDNVLDLAEKNPDTFGFSPEERIDLARMGKPLRVYTIAAADQQNYQDGQAILPLLQATNEWIFPVVLNNQVRFMVPIRRVGQDYVAETSSRSLAMVYQKILDRWPASQGYHPQLVVNPNLADYYFTVPELPNQNLTDTTDMLQYNPTLSPASVMLASWR